MDNKKTVYIIGAGISGLIAAFELEQEGYKPIIIEKSGEVGGRVKTIHENGYALDLGFQVLLSAYPLVNRYLDMDALELCKLESGALIYVNNKAYRIGDPMRNWRVLLSTIFADIGTINDKIKILKLNSLLKRKSIKEIFKTIETTSYQYLIKFGFSQKIIECFFKPFFSGIFLEPNLQTSSRMFEFVYKMFGEGDATIPKLGIGAISNQLKAKLQQTKFIFNCDVKEVTKHHIFVSSGDKKAHDGVILACNSTTLTSSFDDIEIKWKACMCIYFEIDQTNIPANTIALISDSGNYANNLFVYKDPSNGKKILSVTTLNYNKRSTEEIIQKITEEIKKYTKASNVKYIKHYKINQALPDLKNLKSTTHLANCQITDNVFIAGDSQLNGSLNAAMESGLLAAKSFMKSKIQ